MSCTEGGREGGREGEGRSLAEKEKEIGSPRVLRMVVPPSLPPSLPPYLVVPSSKGGKEDEALLLIDQRQVLKLFNYLAYGTRGEVQLKGRREGGGEEGGEAGGGGGWLEEGGLVESIERHLREGGGEGGKEGGSEW